MRNEPDVAYVQGVRVRYACRSVAEVDSHLTGLLEWMANAFPKMHPGQRRAAEANYGRDLDRLLNARVMLASLDTLGVDLAALGADPVA